MSFIRLLVRYGLDGTFFLFPPLLFIVSRQKSNNKTGIIILLSLRMHSIASSFNIAAVARPK